MGSLIFLLTIIVDEAPFTTGSSSWPWILPMMRDGAPLVHLTACCLAPHYEAKIESRDTSLSHRLKMSAITPQDTTTFSRRFSFARMVDCIMW